MPDQTLGQKRRASHQNLLSVANKDSSPKLMKREITSKRGLSKPNFLEVDLDNGDSFAKPSRGTTSKQLVLAKTRSIENLEEKLEKEKQDRIR